MGSFEDHPHPNLPPEGEGVVVLLPIESVREISYGAKS